MSSPQFWTIVWVRSADTPPEYAVDPRERIFGTVEAKGQVVEITTYSGGVGGLPRPMQTRVVPLSRLREWRTDPG